MELLLIAIAIFIWMYLLPVLILGLILFFPVFIIITPVFLFFGLMQFYFNREYLSKINYEYWFGPYEIPTIQKRSLITLHPHGVICTAALVCIHFQPGSTTKFAVAPLLINMPIVGLFVEKLGCIPATKRDIMTALKTNSVILVPGGVPELVANQPYTRRWGFLEISRKAEVDIIQIVCNTSFYEIIDIPLKEFRIWFAKKYGIPIMFPPLGWYGTWIPKPKKIKIETNVFKMNSESIESNRKRYYSILNTRNGRNRYE